MTFKISYHRKWIIDITYSSSKWVNTSNGKKRIYGFETSENFWSHLCVKIELQCDLYIPWSGDIIFFYAIHTITDLRLGNMTLLLQIHYRSLKSTFAFFSKVTASEHHNRAFIYAPGNRSGTLFWEFLWLLMPTGLLTSIQDLCIINFISCY